MRPREAPFSLSFPAHRLWACVSIMQANVVVRGSSTHGAMSSNDGVLGKNPVLVKKWGEGTGRARATVRIRPQVVYVSSCIDGSMRRWGIWGSSTTRTRCWESAFCTGKQGSAKSGGKAPAVHELQCVSGHESYMRGLVLMGTCAGGVLGEAYRYTPCGDRRRFAPENPAWSARGGHRAGPPASFDIVLYTWRTSLSVQSRI